MRFISKHFSAAAALALFVAVVGWRIFACGPDFPNLLLAGGRRTVLVAPEANFRAELESHRPSTPTFPHRPATNGYAFQTAAADYADLRAALKIQGLPEQEARAIVERHERERAAIVRFAEANPEAAFGPPNLTAAVSDGLPGEFADYFRGSIAWHRGENEKARAAWQALLERPPAERPYKSTWAAFMLGKAWLAPESPDWPKAIEYFRQVRSLAKAGFADSLGLAASSLGWEAQAQLLSGNYEAAIDLYLEQAGTTDISAIESLRWTAARALRESDARLRALASKPTAQSVITSYLISRPKRDDFDGREAKADPAIRWLRAVEDAGVTNLDSAERFALAAYQSGEMETARRWLNRARSDAIAARWLRAKLHLYRGEVESAAVLLAKLSLDFPVQPDSLEPEAGNNSELARHLSVPDSGATTEVVAAREQLLGEFGVLRLARREYAEALDALLRSGFWFDAAYVAERVLTVDELKTYVDRHWPAGQPGEVRPVGKDSGTAATPVRTAGSNIRYLLARRLARAGRTQSAISYFPPEVRPQFEARERWLATAHDARRPQAERATAFFEAAKITRNQGLELLGTETTPDWRVHEGNYTFGVTLRERAAIAANDVLKPTKEELDRAARPQVEPETRFHYRYTAAALAMEAARLMPDNDDQTARVLCLAGSWLKDRDPKAADVFYKLLVRRCRKTAVGAEADRLRWFPAIDENGKLIPRPPPPLPPAAPPPALPPPEPAPIV